MNSLIVDGALYSLALYTLLNMNILEVKIHQMT